MPTYRNLTFSLISQFDILTIPEYAPPLTSTSSSSDPFTTEKTPSAPLLVDPSRSTVSVYVPTYPSSQFWLSYSISPPHPPGLLYYFKLLINGDVVVSWGCGEEDGYRGKTMFGLYSCGKINAGRVGKGQKTMSQSKGKQRDDDGEGIESRVFCFGPLTSAADDALDAVTNGLPEYLRDIMEIRVFRSKGRQRILPELTEFKGQGSLGGSSRKFGLSQPSNGVELVNAGRIGPKHPRRYYKYALLDPLDQPFATFRYYYRTWDTLEALGVVSPSASVENSINQEPKESVTVSTTSINTSSDKSSTSSNAAESPSPLIASAFPGGGAVQPSEGSPMARSQTDGPVQEFPSEKIFSSLRPLTPPPASQSSQKITFIPTITGLLPTNLELSEPPSASTSGRHQLNRQTSKETFAALIRSHLPSPDPENFKLNEASVKKPVAHRADTPPPSKQDRIDMKGAGGLKHSISNRLAKQRRRASASSTESSSSSKTSEKQPPVRDLGLEENAEQVHQSQNGTTSVGQSLDAKQRNNGKGKGKEREMDASGQWLKQRERSKKGQRGGRELRLWEEL